MSMGAEEDLSGKVSEYVRKGRRGSAEMFQNICGEARGNKRTNCRVKTCGAVAKGFGIRKIARTGSAGGFNFQRLGLGAGIQGLG